MTTCVERQHISPVFRPPLWYFPQPGNISYASCNHYASVMPIKTSSVSSHSLKMLFAEIQVRHLSHYLWSLHQQAQTSAPNLHRRMSLLLIISQHQVHHRTKWVSATLLCKAKQKITGYACPMKFSSFRSTTHSVISEANAKAFPLWRTQSELFTFSSLLTMYQFYRTSYSIKIS